MRFVFLHAATTLVLLVLLVSCGGPSEHVCAPGASVACVGAGGCAGGQVCNAAGSGYGACVCGGGTDAGPTDAGPIDAGPIDAGPIDAGPIDAGPVDTGVMDAAGCGALASPDPLCQACLEGSCCAEAAACSADSACISCLSSGPSCTSPPATAAALTACATMNCAGPCMIDGGMSTMCGNDTTDSGELCDGSNLAGADCAALGFPGGTLGCLPDCLTYDTSGCTGGEICDNAVDDDGDGFTDCADFDCSGHPGC